MIAAGARRLAGAWKAPWAHSRVLRGFGALGLSELLIRISRILTAIVLARYLDPIEFGLAATAITAFELIRVLANCGVGQMVIRAADDRLAATCNTAYRVMWLVCLAMIALQLGAGFVLGQMTGRHELIAMNVALASVYLFLPHSMVQSWLLQRDGQLGEIAKVSAAASQPRQPAHRRVRRAGLRRVGDRAAEARDRADVARRHAAGADMATGQVRRLSELAGDRCGSAHRCSARRS